MQYLKKIGVRLFSAFVICAVIIYTIILGPAAIIISVFDRSGHCMHYLARYWSRLILFTAGVRVTVLGLENLNPHKQYIIVANHQSLLDIPVTFCYLPLQLRMLAKKELYWIPLFGWAIWMGGHIRLDRSSREQALKVLEKAAEQLRNRDISVMMYPEGTRSSDGTVSKFKSGAFKLALSSGLPIVPVSISGTRFVLPKKSLLIHPGKVAMVIGEAIPVGEKGSIQDVHILRDKIRTIVVQNLVN